MVEVADVLRVRSGSKPDASRRAPSWARLAWMEPVAPPVRTGGVGSHPFAWSPGSLAAGLTTSSSPPDSCTHPCVSHGACISHWGGGHSPAAQPSVGSFPGPRPTPLALLLPGRCGHYAKKPHCIFMWCFDCERFRGERTLADSLGPGRVWPLGAHKSPLAEPGKVGTQGPPGLAVAARQACRRLCPEPLSTSEVSGSCRAPTPSISHGAEMQ